MTAMHGLKIRYGTAPEGWDDWEPMIMRVYLKGPEGYRTRHWRRKDEGGTLYKRPGETIQSITILEWRWRDAR